MSDAERMAAWCEITGQSMPPTTDAHVIRVEIPAQLRSMQDTIARLEAERGELAASLGGVLDMLVLPGHPMTQDAWDRACLLAGRYLDAYRFADLSTINRPPNVRELEAERDALRAELAGARGLLGKDFSVMTADEKAQVVRHLGRCPMGGHDMDWSMAYTTDPPQYRCSICGNKYTIAALQGGSDG